MSAGLFTVRCATAADVENILRIEHAALEGHSRMFPGSVSDPAGFMLHEIEHNRKVFSDPSSTIQWLVAEESASGELAAILQWEAVNNMSKTPHKTAEPGPYGNAGTAAFVDSTILTRREYMDNRPHFYIQILATNPQHQRQGAGRALLTHVLSQADSKGQPTYLESTPSAVIVYKKFGFVETGVRFRFPDGDEVDPPEFFLTAVVREPFVLGSK